MSRGSGSEALAPPDTAVVVGLVNELNSIMEDRPSPIFDGNFQGLNLLDPSPSSPSPAPLALASTIEGPQSLLLHDLQQNNRQLRDEVQRYRQLAERSMAGIIELSGLLEQIGIELVMENKDTTTVRGAIALTRNLIENSGVGRKGGCDGT